MATKDARGTILFDGVVGGWSNNGGTNPYDLALDLSRAGFRDAILLDNGGDVVLCHHSDPGFPDPTHATLPSCESREEWAGVILYHVRDEADLGGSGITLCIGMPEAQEEYFVYQVDFHG